MPYLKYISDQKLIDAVGVVITKLKDAEAEAEIKLHKNIIDPFSATFDGAYHGKKYKEWVEYEKMRQAQKSVQNEIGKFHQTILGSVEGWEDLKTGNLLDIVNRDRKIIAEIKNKHNTTKGNHKTAVYDDIKGMLQGDEYKGYKGYYVEIISKSSKPFDKPFQPSDNRSKKKDKKRPQNENIRMIDGRSFYNMVTGRSGALQELFEVLPEIIEKEFAYRLPKGEYPKYHYLFLRAFGDK
ncbi:MAG: Eco47II family restriction endonuclease [bacterium]|nr:Eco47II family restriction endonuclease [bacterium]